MRVPVKQLKKETNPLPTDTTPLEKTVTGFEEPANLVDKPSVAVPAGNILSAEENLRKRKEMIEAKAFEPSEFAFERAIGNNDSLYSNFIELLALTKRKVGRVVIVEEGKRTGFGTGFMVSQDLLLTNWHVFETKEMAAESEVHFFYEYDEFGHPMNPVIFKFDTERFYTANEELDYCFVAVQPTDVTAQKNVKEIGYLYLDKSLGKIGETGVEKLNIIHHPLGDYKQVSIRENLFVAIDTTRIYYETDTAMGSSGSPVFNDQWQVVGLHHRSIAKMTDDGLNYLDKDNNIIPVIDNKIDTSRIVWLKNEGIRISVIVSHVMSQHPGNELVAGLALPPPKEKLSFSINNDFQSANNNQNDMQSNNGNNITISVPVEALNTENAIDISLSRKRIAADAVVPMTALAAPTVPDEMLLEVLKVDKEKAVDFSKCRGYDAGFLGIEVALPKAKPKLAKQLALLKNKEAELKYFKYSVLFNAVKRMPALSAVNVEGDAKKRLDDSDRNDDWLRDVRIDLECQLTDKFYKGSKFDKGHMSRFEDANWDTTEEKALRNGIYTCFYTNACPQVPALNGAGGLWGKLEKQVLEKGIKKEEGKLARMSVFNGPIFDSNKDRIFKGVVIPMQFFKIILWLNDQQELKATAFKLTQETLVDQIAFDEALRLEDEALDIDKAVAFKNYQCSIKSVSTLTDLDFKHLEPFDTFRKQNGENEILLDTEEALML